MIPNLSNLDREEIEIGAAWELAKAQRRTSNRGLAMLSALSGVLIAITYFCLGWWAGSLAH